MIFSGDHLAEYETIYIDNIAIERNLVAKFLDV